MVFAMNAVRLTLSGAVICSGKGVELLAELTAFEPR